MDIVLKNTHGTFKVSCSEILGFLASELDFVTDNVTTRPPTTTVTTDYQPQRMSGSSMTKPGLKTVRIESLRDVVAFQGLWAAGKFTNYTCRFDFVRWKVLCVMFPVQHTFDSVDLKIEPYGSSVLSTGSYYDVVHMIRVNIPHFWDDSAVGHAAVAREIRQALKGKASTQSADTWNADFMNVLARMVSFMFCAEGARANIMIPLSMMAIELAKHGSMDLGSLGGLKLDDIKGWKGPVLPFYQDCVKSAQALKNAAVLLSGDEVDEGKQGAAQSVINGMESLVKTYFEMYLSAGSGVMDKSKVDVSKVDSDKAFRDLVYAISIRKFSSKWIQN